MHVLGFTEKRLIGAKSVVGTLTSNGITTCTASFLGSRLVSTANIVAVPRLKTSAPRSRSGYTIVTISRLGSCVRGNGVAGSMGVPTMSMPEDNGAEVAVVRGGIPGIVDHVATVITRRGVGVSGVIGGSHKRCTCAVLSASARISGSTVATVSSRSFTVEMEIVGWGLLWVGGCGGRASFVLGPISFFVWRLLDFGVFLEFVCFSGFKGDSFGVGTIVVLLGSCTRLGITVTVEAVGVHSRELVSGAPILLFFGLSTTGVAGTIGRQTIGCQVVCVACGIQFVYGLFVGRTVTQNGRPL